MSKKVYVEAYVADGADLSVGGLTLNAKPDLSGGSFYRWDDGTNDFVVLEDIPIPSVFEPSGVSDLVHGLGMVASPSDLVVLSQGGFTAEDIILLKEAGLI